VKKISRVIIDREFLVCTKTKSEAKTALFVTYASEFARFNQSD